MKKYLMFLFGLLLFMVCTSCKEKIDIEKEREAIKTLIYNESQAYMQKDTARLASYYIQDDNQTRLTTSCDTIQLYRGWLKISTLLKNADFTGYSNLKNTKDFINIKVMGNEAWAMYKDIWTGNKNETPIKSTLYCTMILEKVANEWKISGFSFNASTK
jgi:ketosteroid isomerase-like protein